MIVKALAATLFAMLISALPVLAFPTISNTSCSATEVNLVYNCKFELMENGHPIVDTKITVGASMPTMPMAHNIKPVTAQASNEKPGQYMFELQLEMFGEWLVVFDIFDPVRDRFKEKITFNSNGSARSASKVSE